MELTKYLKYKTKYLALKQRINMNGGSGKGGKTPYNKFDVFSDSDEESDTDEVAKVATDEVIHAEIPCVIPNVNFTNVGDNPPNHNNLSSMALIATSSADVIKGLTYALPILYEDYDSNNNLTDTYMQTIHDRWNNTSNSYMDQDMVVSDHKYIQGNISADTDESFFSWNTAKNTDYFKLKPNTKQLLGNNKDKFMNSVGRINLIGEIIHNITKFTNNIIITIQECDLSLHKILETVLPGHCGHFIPKRINQNERSDNKIWIQEDGMSIFVKKGLTYNLNLLTYTGAPTDNLNGLNIRTALVSFPDKNVVVTHCRQKEYDAYNFIRDIFNNDPKPLYVIGDFNLYRNSNSNDIGKELKKVGLSYEMITTNGHLDHLIKITNIPQDSAFAFASASASNVSEKGYGKKQSPSSAYASRTPDNSAYGKKQSSSSSRTISHSASDVKVQNISGELTAQNDNAYARYSVKVTHNNSGMCSGTITNPVRGKGRMDAVIANIHCNRTLKPNDRVIVEVQNGMYVVTRQI